jgi:hypothetical protein
MRILPQLDLLALKKPPKSHGARPEANHAPAAHHQSLTKPPDLAISAKSLTKRVNRKLAIEEKVVGKHQTKSIGTPPDRKNCTLDFRGQTKRYVGLAELEKLARDLGTLKPEETVNR